MIICNKCETLDVFKCCKKCELIMFCPSPCEDMEKCKEELDNINI